MIGVGAKRKGRRDGAAVWMVRVGCGGAVVRWCSVDGCASPAVRRGRCAPAVAGCGWCASVAMRAWMGASVVARARERRYVRVGGGTIADDVVSLGRDLADQPGAAILRTSRAPRSRRGSQLDLLGDGDVVAGDQWRPGVGCGGIVNLGKLLDPTGELT